MHIYIYILIILIHAMYTYVYIYIDVCVCVCVCAGEIVFEYIRTYIRNISESMFMYVSLANFHHLEFPNTPCSNLNVGFYSNLFVQSILNMWFGRWCWLTIFLGKPAGIINRYVMVLQNVSFWSPERVHPTPSLLSLLGDF